MTESDFYSSSKWRRLRRTALGLYGDQCMNCGLSPADTGKAPHVDHIWPRSRFSHLELSLGNLQVLCESCNCDMKGTHVADFRTPKHMHLLEQFEGGQHVLRDYVPIVPIEEAENKDYACKRALDSARRLGPKQIKKRLRHIVQQYGKERVESLAIGLAGFRS